jgi:hypothetical protein
MTNMNSEARCRKNLRVAFMIPSWTFLAAQPTSPFRSAGEAFHTALSVVVQVFGRRHDDAIHALRRPASEKRQGTKSRELGTGGAAGAMGI